MYVCIWTTWYTAMIWCIHVRMYVLCMYVYGQYDMQVWFGAYIYTLHALLTGVCLMSVWCLSDVCPMSVWCLCGVCLMSVWCLSDVCLMSVWCLSDVCLMSVWCLSVDRLTSVWCLSCVCLSRYDIIIVQFAYVDVPFLFREYTPSTSSSPAPAYMCVCMHACIPRMWVKCLDIDVSELWLIFKLCLILNYAKFSNHAWFQIMLNYA